MNVMQKKQLLLTLIVSMIYGALFSQINAKPFVIPALQQWQGANGTLHLTKQVNICYVLKDHEAKKAAFILSDDLKQWGHVANAIAGRPKNGNVLLSILPEYDALLGNEGYRLNTTDHITISANTYRGLFWGTRTLLQLLEQSPEGNIPKGKAIDYPKYPVRGLVLDAGRKYFTLEFLKLYVKLLSYYKMSEFQIHLNDNGFKKYFGNNWDSTYSGFRLESATYPTLATKGEFYTKEAFRNFQIWAADYGVSIIPEIDVPAHSLAFTKAIPEIGSKKYGMDHLDITNPKTYEVVENVFKEYLSGPNPVFVGKEVHIGTDEYAKEEAESFRAFTDHFIKYVQGFGKNARAWGALTHAAGNTPVTSKNVTLNMWYNGYADPVEMKKLGYKQISTPDGYLYIVPAAGYYYDYLNLPFLYKSWTPLQIGKVRFKEGDTSVVGGMFAVWNDIVGNGITAMDVHDRVFPALQVLSEKMWSSVTDTLNYRSFAQSAKKILEGPGLNMQGLLNKNDSSVIRLKVASRSLVNDRNEVVASLSFNNINLQKNNQADTLTFSGNSYIQSGIEHLGHPYRVVFDINPTLQKNGAILFADPAWQTSLEILEDGRLAFFRENYKDTFSYPIPFLQWTSIAIEGNKKSVALFVNGQLVDHLKGYRKPMGARDSIYRSQTLFFPLQQVGAPVRGFKGKIANIKIQQWRKKD